MDEEESDFGSDIQLDDELEEILDNVKPQASVDQSALVNDAEVMDMEDAVPRLSPLEQFRKKGWLSVSDLVGTVWCEVQYDYRLRTLPFLPPEQRPAEITSREGRKITVDKVKVEGKERILKRGEKIHKRLEREIHPEEIIVHAVTREDVWGLRFLNMVSALEALITLGKCRELPVVGFVKGILVMGVIDEIARKPIGDTPSKPNTRSSAPDRSQTSLTTFFSPSKPRPMPVKKERSHRLFVSDSKTRASGTIPRESDTLAGRLQVMLYKELLDALLLPHAEPNEVADKPHAILPTETPFSWNRIFSHLDLRAQEPFSESFMMQSKPIILGNGLKHGVDKATNLAEMVLCWRRYVEALGLGTPFVAPVKNRDKKGEVNTARTEDRLELVYRRAGAYKKRDGPDVKIKSQTGKRRGKRKQSSSAIDCAEPFTREEEDEAIQQAIRASLDDIADGHASVPETNQTNQAITETRISVQDREDEQDADVVEDELAWAIEMSLGASVNGAITEDQADIAVKASQITVNSPNPSPLEEERESSTSASHSADASQASETPVAEVEKVGSGSGSIIGRTVFTHSPRRLAAHLSSVLDWWLGHREAVGVSIEETRRCGWCEFEEGCEWRSKKAREATERFRAANTSTQSVSYSP